MRHEWKDPERGRTYAVENGNFYEMEERGPRLIEGRQVSNREILRLAERVRELEGSIASVGRACDEHAALASHWSERAAALEAENTALREAASEFLSRILSLRSQNTPEWMEHLPEDVNAFAEALGMTDRVVLSRDGDHLLIRRNGPSAPPQEPLPAADEVYGIFTPCPCGVPHEDGWCVAGRVIYDDAR